MHEKVDPLFTQKLRDKNTSGNGKHRNELPLSLLSPLFQKLFSDSFQCNVLYPYIYKQPCQEL